MRSYHIIGIGLVIAFAAWAGAQDTQPTGLPPTLRSSLDRNAALLSPITINSTFQYETALGKEAALKQLNDPTDSSTFFMKKTERLIIQGDKVYNYEKSEQPVGGRSVHEESFDGSNLYSGTPDTVRPDGNIQAALSKYSLKSDRWFISSQYLPAAGFRLPSQIADVAAGKRIRAEIVALIEDDGGTIVSVQPANLAGTPVTEVRVRAENPLWKEVAGLDMAKVKENLKNTHNTPEQNQAELDGIARIKALPHYVEYDFFLDPALNFAVRRRDDRYEDGTLLRSCVNEDFKQVGDRPLWLPWKSVTAFHAFRSVPGKTFTQPVVSAVVRITELRTDPVPDHQFTLRYTMPGAVLFDKTRPGPPVVSVVPSQVHDLDRALSKIPKPSSGSPIAERLFAWPMIVLLNVLGAVAVAILLWRRMRRRSER